MLSITYEDGLYVAHPTSKIERQILRRMGLSLPLGLGQWETTNLKVVVALREYLDDNAKSHLKRKLIKVSPWRDPLPNLKPGLKLRRFQEKIVIPWILSRNFSYLAVDMGLGKTVCAAVASEAEHAAWGNKIVYVCPANLTRNVAEEFEKWTALTVERLDPKEPKWKEADVLIVPDSVISRPEVLEEIKEHVYKCKRPRLYIDEVHRYKEPKSQRSEALWGITDLFERVCVMSGTPVPNGRPIELWPIIERMAHQVVGFMSERNYGKRYCAGWFDTEEGAWNFSGASNVIEWRTKLRRHWMLRVKKSDVLKELPPKIQKIIIMGKRPPRMIALEKKILAKYSPSDLLKAECSPHISTYRRELGLLKVPSVIKYVRSLLNDFPGRPVVLFAYHKEVVTKLVEGLDKFKPLYITGSTPNAKRHLIAKQFQNGESDLFIGNYKAAGVGITLTRGKICLHAEPSFVPGDNDQASDRLHRIGQSGQVYSLYLCFENSLDRRVIEIETGKRNVTDTI